MATYNEKDIYLARRTTHGTFEEAPLVVQPNSMVVTDANNNLIMVSSASINVAHAVLADFAQSASYAVSASYEIVFETSASHSEMADEAISASYVPNLYPQEYLPSASWASASISASYAANVPDTASYALEALSASEAEHSVIADSATFASDAQLAETASLAYTASFVVSASYALQALSASWAPMPTIPSTDSASWASSSISASHADQADNAISASYVPDLYPQTVQVSCSWASSSISASYVPNLYPQEYLPSASWASASISASYSETASYAANVPDTASYALQALSASWAPQPIVPESVASASWASSSVSSSYSDTAISTSYVPNLYPQTEQVSCSWASSSISASYVPNLYPQEYLASASWASASLSASYVPNLYPQEYLPSASWASASISASYVPNLYPQEYLPSASWASASLSASYAISASHLDADTLHLGRLGGDGGTIELYDETNDAYYSIHGADEAIEVNKTFVITNGDLVLNSGFFNGNGSHITNIIFASSSISSSWASQSLSASLADTASYLTPTNDYTVNSVLSTTIFSGSFLKLNSSQSVAGITLISASTEENGAQMYVGVDPVNPIKRALFIVPPGGSTRIFFGSSSKRPYSLNFANVDTIESFPATLTMASSSNNSTIASERTSDLILQVGSIDGNNWITSGKTSHRKSLAFKFYACDTDTYQRSAGFIFASNSGSTTYHRPHTIWNNSNTEATSSSIMMLDMSGSLYVKQNVTSSQIRGSYMSADGTAGLTQTVYVTSGSTWLTMSFKNGLLTATE